MTNLLALWLTFAPADDRFAELRVVDAATRRGVPLAVLETVNRIRFVTDNGGRIALADPELLDRECWFSIQCHGYAPRRDGFGFAGVRVTPRVGHPVEIELDRVNVAQRLCRLTGEGRWRDTLLLGGTPPLLPSPHPGGVAGQDSIQATLHRGRVWCLWGDTQRLDYPLGLFRMAGATLPIPDPADPASDPQHGLAYDYFTDPQSGFARAMVPIAERPEGVVWVSAIASVPDASGAMRLVGHYSRRASLEMELEQGIVALDDERQRFEPVVRLPAEESWRKPSGHPLLVEEGATRWLYYGSPNPNVRVPARYEALLDPAQYEAFTCEPAADPLGAPTWRWQKEQPPSDSTSEAAWVKEGKLDAKRTRFLPVNAADANEHVVLHRGSVRWNAHRQRYVLIACQLGGTASFLGEIWYAEAKQPTGPFTTAVKVVTHDRQSFYNPCHHDFLDRDGGRTIHFEGTYTNDFSGNSDATPRYQYNQILYRLDLDAPALQAARVE